MDEGMPDRGASESPLTSGWEGAIVFDGHGHLVVANDAATRIIGGESDGSIDDAVESLVVRGAGTDGMSLSALVSDGGEVAHADFRSGAKVELRCADGHSVSVSLRILPIGDSVPVPAGYLVLLYTGVGSLPVAGRRLDGEWYHRCLARISRVITRTLDIPETLRAVLQELLDIYGADRAWLIHPCDPQAPSWNIHVEATRPEYPGAYEERQVIPMDARAASLMERALGTDDPVTCEVMEGVLKTELVDRYSIRSQLMVSLHPKLGPPWLLGMHQCSHARHWTGRERNLLRDIGERLTDALTNQILHQRLEEDVARRQTVEAALNLALQEHQGLIDATPDVVFRTDLDGRLTHWNRSLAAIGRVAPSALQGFPIRELFPDSEKAFFDRLVTDTLAAGQGETELALLDCTGAQVPYHWIAVPLWSDSGEVVGLTGFGRNIADRKRDEQVLRQAAVVFENTPDAVVITDADMGIVRVNTAFTRITGFRDDEACGRPASMLGWSAEEAERIRSWVRDAGYWQGEVGARRKSGEPYPARLSMSAVRDGEGPIASYVMAFADITDLKRYECQLEHLAHHDELTGLPNRLMCDVHVEHALQTARSAGSTLALVFIDLDGFKEVNDSYGHAFGDRVLKDVAARLARNIREGGHEQVFRLGGDEFVIVLEGCDDADAVPALARRTLDLLSAPFALEGKRIVLSASIGISLFPDDGGDRVRLLQSADAAMYRAKELGKNRFQFHSRGR